MTLAPEAVFVAGCVLPALVISALAGVLVRRWAPRLGLMDAPAERKVHRQPTPLGGGIAVWLGVVIPLACVQLAAWALTRSGSPEWLPIELARHLDGVLYRADRMWWIVAAGTSLALIGLIDDFRGLPWRSRLAAQFCVAVLLTVAGVRATIFVAAPWAGVAVTVLWIMVLVNALNFLDNMDGLAGGIALIAATLFAVIMLTAPAEPRWLVAGVLLVLAGSLGGFLLFHNRPPAKLFMGDAGSYFIGLMLAALTVTGTFYEQDMGSRHVMLAPLCILAVPLYDFCSVTIIRLAAGRSPFHADKSHFSHRLVERGLTPTGAVLTIHLATLTTGLGGLLLYRVPDWTAAVVVIGLVACVLAIVAILEAAGNDRS